MSLRQLKISQSITNRESESLDKYLQEINKLQLITPQEEVQLAVLIKLGDENAVDQLTKANLRFVVSVAKQYQNQGLPLADLINEGNIGLIKAARLYDQTKGFKFISYAIWWIRQAIMQAIAEKSRLVRLPINRVGMTNQVHKAFTRLEQEFEREPSAEEIAESLNLDTNDVVLTIAQGARHISMDAPSTEGEENTMLDFVEDSNIEKTDFKLIHMQSLKVDLARCLKTLNDNQKTVLFYHYGIGIDRALTLDEIAEKMNLSRERVRQIKDKALEMLRNSQQADVLRNYLSAA